jgi:heavy metal sensor kinase
MFDSVRIRLTVWYASVLAISLITFAFLVYYAAARIFYDRQDESLRSTAETVASAYIQEFEEEGSIAKANEVVLAQMIFPNRYVAVVDSEGRIVAQSSNLTGHSLTLSAATLNTARVRSVDFDVSQTIENERPGVRVAVVPLSNDTGNSLGYAVVGESLKVIEEGLRRLRLDFFAGVPLILGLASVGGYILARKSLAPIALMNSQTRRITAESLSSRLDVPDTRDEIGGLAATINSLLARLDAAFKEQQRFIADASHELRTPLAVLRGEAEVSLQKDRSLEDYKNSLSLIKDEAERLTRIVENLFILAGQPVDKQSMTKVPVNLNEIVLECLRAAQVLAIQKGLRMELAGVLPDVEFAGDDELLKRMLLNLLDNAVKYTDAGGEIKVQLGSQNGTVRIVVKDSGIGIPLPDQPRIFDRFYRVDKTRSRALGGAGLGLSIAKWIVEAHEGELTVESTPSSGSAFIVELPILHKQSKFNHPESCADLRGT